MSIRSIFRLTAVAFISLSAFCVCAQMPSPVRWSSTVECGDTCKVIIQAVLHPGWHLYALELPDGGPRPTEINLSESTGVAVIGAPEPSRPAIKVDDEMFGMTLAWWNDNVAFRIPFVITNRESARIVATVSYMMCNGESCLPPRTEKFSIPLNNQKQ